MKDCFRAKSDNKYRSKNRQARNERADDQIAPAAAMRSIDALQRWALATANIAQNGHRANESQIVERIQSRYGNSNASSASTRDASKGFHEHEDPEHSSNVIKTTTAKRKHDTSPTRTPNCGERYVNNTIEADTRQAKRRRKEEEESGMDDDDIYAQSSEWSFPSGDEVKTKKTRTYIEID